MAIKIQGSTIIDDSRKVINASHVGIGTTNPTVELDVDGNANISGIVTAGEFKELYNGQYWSVVTQADVGYGASQVPLNQYLGQLAFLDDHHPNGLRRDGASSDDVFVNSSGYVGIGSAQPIVKLDVDGDARITGISTLSGVKISSGIITAVSGVVTYYGDGSNLTGVSASPGGSDGQIQYNNGGSFGGAAQLYYDDANNRLGINSSTPAYSLDLGESASTIRLVSESGGTAIRIGAGGQNDFTLFRVDGGTTAHGETDSAGYGFSFKYLGSGTANNNKLQILSDNQEGTAVQAFTMLQDGKIGIANTAPSTELEVGGTITATNYTGKTYINESTGPDTEHPLIFIQQPYALANLGNTHFDLDIDSGGIRFNPGTNTLFVDNISGSLAGIATGATRVYVDESEDDNANYHMMFSDITPGGGDEYRTLQVDTNGIQFNPYRNHLKVNGPDGAVAIGTIRNTDIDASLEIDHNSIVGTAYTNSLIADHNGNIRITADESTIELIGSDSGNHAASIYIRNLNEGYAFINNPTTEELELKSFTASANAFHATGSNGANVSSINKLLRIGKDGNIGVGDIDAAFKLDVDGGVRVSSGSSITFAGPTTTGAFYHANNADTTLLRVTSDGSTANLSGDYGFTLKYLGSGSANNNKLQILSDNQNAGTQVQAFTMLQDGKIGIANTAPSTELEVGGTITATSFSGSGVNLTNVDATTLDGIDSGSFLRSDAADTKTSGNLTFSDQIQAAFGASSDMVIEHDSTDNHITSRINNDLNIELEPDGGTPKLYLRPTTNSQGITLGGGSGNPVELYHTNAKKFETTGIGVSIVGVGNTATITGPSNLVLDPAAVGDGTGTVTILGDLQVDGVQTIINSTTLEVDDKLVSIAKSATNATQANGAGLEINGASATLTYASSGDKWVFNKAPHYNTNRLLTTADEGSGNGLDADTLDSLDSLSFLRSDVADIKTTGDIRFNDNIGITFGGSDNSRIFHDGTDLSLDLTAYVTDFKIRDGTTERYTFTKSGKLSLVNVNASGVITATSFVKSSNSGGFLKADGTEDTNTYLTSADGGDAATLDTLDSTQFLRSDAADTKTSGDLSFSDAVEAKFGDDSDLRIYHNSHSYIIHGGASAVGNLIIRNTVVDQDIVMMADDGSGSFTTYLQAEGASGELSLHHYGSKKLATKAYGIDVTGRTETDTLNVSGISTFQDDIEVTGNVEKYDTLVGSASTTTVEFAVTVAAKSDHRYTGGVNGASTNGYYLDGIESPFLTFTPGKTYRFTLSSGDMTSHPFRLYLEADRTTEYTENVTSTSTYTEIVVTESTPSILYYQCSAHPYMGNAIQTNGSTLVDGRHVAAPNATVPVHSLSGIGTETNIDVALVPKGSGAILADIPDGSATGGNKRGAGAVDLQLVRMGGSAVASGMNAALIGGSHNTASGNYSFIGGSYASTVSGTYSAGFGNHITVSGDESYAFGTHSLADSDHSIVLGGKYASTRTIQGLVVIPASDNPHSTDQNGRALCQKSILNVYAQTTDATPTVLRSDVNGASTTNQLTLKNNSAITFKATCVAGVTGAGNTKVWELRGALKRGANAASTALVGSVIKDVIAYDSGAAAWDLEITADTTNGAIKVEVTGQAATTIRWVCTIEATEMSF